MGADHVGTSNVGSSAHHGMAVKDDGAFDVASRFDRGSGPDQNWAVGSIEGGRAHHGVFCHQNLVCRSIGVGGRCRRKGAEIPSRHQRVHILPELLPELGKQVVGGRSRGARAPTPRLWRGLPMEAQAGRDGGH